MQFGSPTPAVPHATISCVFPRGSSSARKHGDEVPTQWRPLSLTGLLASAHKPTRHCKLPVLIKCIKHLIPIRLLPEGSHARTPATETQENHERAETLTVLSQGGLSDQRAEMSSARYCTVTYKEWNAVDVYSGFPFL